MLLDNVIRVIAVAATAIIIAGVCTSDFLGLESFFSWHPIFMSVGTVLLLSLGVVGYVSDLGKSLNQTFPDRPSRRVVHGAIQFTALCCLILGFLCAWAVHEKYDLSQVAAKKTNTIQAHVWIGYLVLVGALCNAVVGQLKFVVKARDNKTIAKYHGQVGSVVYVLGMVCACLGVAHVMLHKSEEATQHALGITAIVLIAVLLVLVLLEVLCIPQITSQRSSFEESTSSYGYPGTGFSASLNGGR